MKKLYIITIIGLFLFIGFSTSMAVTYIVDDAASLSAALIAAAADPADDEIYLEAGTYTGNFAAVNYSTNSGSLSMIGAGPELTILDGDFSDRALYVYIWNSSGDPLSNITIHGMTIRNGRSDQQGGGAYLLTAYGDIIVDDVAFTSNESTNHNGGGAVFQVWYEGNISVSNCLFGDNRSYSNGGGLRASIAGIGGDIELINNKVFDNECTTTGCHGGGIHATISSAASGKITCSGNTAIGNTSGIDGGGISIWGESIDVKLVNNVIADNTSRNGGGIGLGFNNSLTFTNNTVTDNSASAQGAGLYIDNYDFDNINANIYNNIIWGNTGENDIYIESGGTANLYNNNFSTISTFWITVSESSNLDYDPLFVSGIPPYNLNLQQTSQLIDMGNNGAPGIPSTDIDGESRVQDGDGDGNAIVDLGAYEFMSASAPSIEDTIDFFDQAVDNGTIYGSGFIFTQNLNLVLFDRNLSRVIPAIENGLYGVACFRLRLANQWSDGEGYDLIQGEDTEELSQMIYDFAESLECRWVGN